MRVNVLVTGGAGYIGSHTVIQLIEKGYNVVVIDNFSNSSKVSLERVEQITGVSIDFYQGDIRDYDTLKEIFKKHEISAVIHFAGLKAVGESTLVPLDYYDNNVSGTVALCKVMAEFDCKNLVFSSSATVYGDPEMVPIRESFKTQATNPYGRSKLVNEEILTDLSVSDSEWNIVLLRYFNPIGAHPSGRIGEDPNDIPNNLLPYISQVAIGKLKELKVYGSDYPTEDGTGVRDYIHVVDLANGHLKAMDKLNSGCGLEIYNLGTGKGYSVLEIVKAFEKASGVSIPYKVVERRPGDIAECWADPQKAKSELDWWATFQLEDMMRDTWNWQKNNPNGYR
ncbi:MAG: UDP-glucose 4-epimerase GalE [Gammaproteobacteria bacterium]|nr:UDP-glucose 4-epimerase GalE [Gammaproteobacteria bacterium]